MHLRSRADERGRKVHGEVGDDFEMLQRLGETTSARCAPGQREMRLPQDVWVVAADREGVFPDVVRLPNVTLNEAHREQTNEG